MFELQKSIYERLISHSSSNFEKLAGIFTCTDKDTTFPHILLSISRAKDLSNFSQKMMWCEIQLNIFDKNMSNFFTVSVIEEIIEIVGNVNYLQNIIEIKNTGYTVEYKDGIWDGKITFEAIFYYC